MSDTRTIENDTHLLAEWWVNVGQSGSDAEKLAKRVLELEREVAALRAKTIEECAKVLDQIVAGMESHKNPDGIVTGRDFHHPEIDYIEQAAARIRALKAP